MALSMIYGYEGNIHANGQIILQVGGASRGHMTSVCQSHDNIVLHLSAYSVVF